MDGSAAVPAVQWGRQLGLHSEESERRRGGGGGGGAGGCPVSSISPAGPRHLVSAVTDRKLELLIWYITADLGDPRLLENRQI